MNQRAVLARKKQEGLTRKAEPAGLTLAGRESQPLREGVRLASLREFSNSRASRSVPLERFALDSPVLH